MGFLKGILIILVIVVIAAAALYWSQTTYGIFTGTSVRVMCANGSGLTVDSKGSTVSVTSTPTALQVVGSKMARFLGEGAPFSLYDPVSKKYVATTKENGKCVVATAAAASGSLWYFQGTDMNAKKDTARVVPGKGYVLSPIGAAACEGGTVLKYDLTFGDTDVAASNLWSLKAAL